MTNFEILLKDYQAALARFEEIFKEKKNEIVRDSAIKRFEILFDLAWKVLKTYLEEFHSLYCASPQNCLREAFRVGILEYDDYWLEIAKTRNRTVHTYSEEMAEEIFKELPKTLSYFQKLVEKLEKPKISKI